MVICFVNLWFAAGSIQGIIVSSFPLVTGAGPSFPFPSGEGRLVGGGHLTGLVKQDCNLGVNTYTIPVVRCRSKKFFVLDMG